MEMFSQNVRMPSKDLPKQSYPPCNRAFALRMMNPMSYSQNHQSPLDGEIQPVIKISIAKNIDGKLSCDNSVDDVSLSPASSMTSLQDMELYDIDEHDHGVANGNLPDYKALKLNRSFEINKSRKSPRSSVTGKVNSNGFMSRSYSSSDGFTRGTSHRISTPVRVRCGSSPDKAMQNGGTPSPRKQNNGRSEIKAVDKVGSPLQRSQSLRDRSRPIVLLRSSNNNPATEQKVSAVDNRQTITKIRVAATRSSELRARLNNSNTGSNSSIKTDSKQLKPKQPRRKRLNVNKLADDESDVSVVIHSEKDAYHPRNNPRNIKSVNEPLEPRERHDSTLSEASSLDSYDSALPVNRPSVPSSKPVLNHSFHSNIALPSQHDLFSQKLSSVCNLITEQYPGDFQLLETLVDMQASYEERNEMVADTFAQLQNKVSYLETKLLKGPNIPGMVIPLMRATTNFQQQLQSIMDAQQQTKCTADKSVQVSENRLNDLNSVTTFEEISCEANNVIAQLEKLSARDTETCEPRDTETDVAENVSTDIISNGFVSDADSYAVIYASEPIEI